ncbi:inorganic phosphate transporter [Brevibacterium sp. BRM-1]|uniref:inorganic phosphate transporter n=1 Tax=Brevibacterium sp. BRM-1 TaxID=2999062 RepID=UPI002281B7B6|nr:inorganic phosphate transporter [Brevibacterium sp. BRM-1]WAL39947.1 inorganic phosphate transporter [Brevibacterium sp. BRM-1]
MEAAFAVALALGVAFAFINGFHDTGVAVGNALATRALTRRAAFALAAVFNFAGALIGQGVVDRLVMRLLDAPHADASILLIIIAALAGGGLVNLGTYFLGLPIASTHCLVGGMIGAGFVFGITRAQSLFVDANLPRLLFGPLAAFLLALLVTLVVLPLLRSQAPKPLFRFMRQSDSVLVAALSFAHGAQDSQKIGAVLAVALAAATGRPQTMFADNRSWWIILVVALALALGTYTSGTRVAYTMSSRLVSMDPPRAVIADGVSTVLMYIAAFALRVPLAMSFIVAASNLGTQVGRRRGAVQPRVLAAVAGAWLLGLPASALCAAIIAWPLLVLAR